MSDIFDESKLTPDQKEALQAMRSGKDVFVTGVGGTGKSTVIRSYISEQEKLNKNIIICAPTGIAAKNIDGSTLHSQFLIKFGIVSPDIYPREYLKMMSKKSPGRYEMFKHVDIIIIDEISMVRYDYFEFVMKLIEFERNCPLEDDNGRIISKNHPIQVIVSGDFGQLAPVLSNSKYDRYHKSTYSESELFSLFYPKVGDEPWAFLSPYWKFETHELMEVIRQDDEALVDALCRIRIGNKTGIDFINEHSAKQVDDDAIVICGTNKEVDTINELSLKSLPGTEYEIEAKTFGQVNLGDYKLDRTLRLKIGAKVMTLINDPDKEYANGSFGEVLEVKIDKKKYSNSYVKVRFDDGKVCEVRLHTWEATVYTYDKTSRKVSREAIGKIIAFPLRLRYAITVHKSQGQTYKKVVFIPRCFSAGQLYTALSRVTSLEGLYIQGKIPYKALIVSKPAIDFYKNSYKSANQITQKPEGPKIKSGFFSSVNDLLEKVQ